MVLLIGSCLLAQAQSSPSSLQQQPTDEMQQPAATQQPAPQQAPANQPPESMSPQNAPSGQQTTEEASPQGSNVAAALQVYASPKANQTPDKQAQDESECYQWSQGQGAPLEKQGVQQGAQQQGQSGRQNANKAGTDAMAKGSAGGAVMRATDNVKRAYSACMQSRNYTIN